MPFVCEYNTINRVIVTQVFALGEPSRWLPTSHKVVNDQKLFTPAFLVREWTGHELCGKQFESFLSEFTQRYGVIDPGQKIENEAAEEAGKDGKRKGGEEEPGPSPKKLKFTIDSNLVVANDSIASVLLHECRVGGKDAPTIQLRTPNEMFLVNKGEKDWSGSDVFAAGFGKGSFKLIKDQDMPAGAVEFKMETTDTLVHYNGSLTTLDKVIAEARQKKPDTKVCYHKMDGASLSQTHRVVFAPRAEERSGEVTLNNFAVRQNVSTWMASPCLAVVWYVKNMAKGICPVKPAVHLKGSVTLPCGKALKCHT